MQETPQTFSQLKTIHGASDQTTYVVIAEDADLKVAVKPEATMVYFDNMRRFFQIGFRIHVRPQEGKALNTRDDVAAKLGIGHLSKRDGSRLVGFARIPACNLTLSPWVVQEHIVEGMLIEQLVNAVFDRLEAAGLTMACKRDTLIDAARERFLDLIPDNKVPLPEVKVYFGKDSYYPPQASGPPVGISTKGATDDSDDSGDDDADDGDDGDEDTTH